MLGYEYRRKISALLFTIMLLLFGVTSKVYTGLSWASQKYANQLWTCSMHPQIKLPHPGKCPICGMELIPVAQKTSSSKETSIREITLSPVARKLAEIQTSVVKRMPVSVDVRLTGEIDYDERRVAYITAWVPGRLEKVFVNFTGVYVERGTPMVEIYSPELFSAQVELLHAIKAVRHLKTSSLSTLKSTAYETVRSAKDKLKLWGLSDEQINKIIRSGRPSYTMTIYSPISGTVVHKNGVEGMYVKTGTRIYIVADLSYLWLLLDAYESDLTWVKKGDEVIFEVESFPGESFRGNISFIDPFVNPKTRTVRVRVDVFNKGGRLKPGMFARAVLKSKIDTMPPPVVIPASAPLITGKRAIVYVEVPGKPGTYEGREIVLGPRAGKYYVVRYGLKEGERVVTNGNFKIDSALQIKARPSMMTPEGGGGGGMKHHGGQMKKKSPGDSKMKSSPVKKVPEAFEKDLYRLLKLFDEILVAEKSQNERSIKIAYHNFRSFISKVNTDGLSGHSRMMWNELSMLFVNDVIVGLEAKRPLEKQDALSSLVYHMERLKEQFKLSSKKH